jgi:UDP-glucuronate decarboxylase
MDLAVDDGRVTTNFVVQALAGKNLTVYGDGTQARSFCYIAALIEGLDRSHGNGELYRACQSRKPG